MVNDLAEITPEGRMLLHFHPGQWRAWHSERNTVAIIAGTQSGKTSFGPYWLYREIQRRGPGDYMVVTPTYPLLAVKALPEFLKLFQGSLRLGKFTQSPIKKFEFSERGQNSVFGKSGTEQSTTVFFGHAGDPDSLESATIKGVLADEAGQKGFRLSSWQALERRCSIYDARKLITTTPYNMGWLKTEIFDRWKNGDQQIDVINFPSIENPRFPREVYERARYKLPAWKFMLFYEGVFTQPAGLIYDCYNHDTHIIKSFPVPRHWPRMVGVDPFGAYIAAVWLALDTEANKLHLYREYRGEFGKTTPGHAAEMLKLSQGETIFVWAGGGPSERQARLDFADAGIPLQEPGVTEVWSGIDKVYQLLKDFTLVIHDNCKYTQDDLSSYSRVMKDDEMTDDIEDKESYHMADALRYIIAWITRPQETTETIYDPVQIGRGW
jgi:hypothetical protein